MSDLLDAARDIVALWRNPRIQGLPRSERNGAIEDARNRLIAAVEASGGYAIVPIEPPEAMLAAALPLSAKEPSYDDKRLGARACMLLSGSLSIPNEGSAVLAAAQLAMDYRAMVAVAPAASATESK